MMRSVTLGRGTRGAFDVGDAYPRVSRRHAEIAMLDPDTYRLTDLGSSNGTEIFEGGQWLRVSEATISRRQRFRLGGEFDSSIEDLTQSGCEFGPGADVGLDRSTEDKLAQFLIMAGAAVLVVGVVMTAVQMFGELGSASDAPCFTCKISTTGEFVFETRYPGIVLAALGLASVVAGYWKTLRSEKR